MSESTLSSEVSAITILPAPTNVNANISGSDVSVTWTNNDDSTDGYIDVEESLDGGNTFTTVGSNLNRTDTSYATPIPTGSSTAQYRVTRVTDHTSTTSVDTTVQLTPPAPQNVASVYALDSIRITWDEVSNADAYKIYRSGTSGTTIGDYTFVTSVNAPADAYDDTGAASGIAQYYRISATNTVGESPLSNEVSPTIGIPRSPESLSAPTVGASTATLNWDDKTAEETGYDIYLSQDDGQTWTLEASVPADTTTYQFSGLTNGETYTAKVEASNAQGSVMDATVTQDKITVDEEIQIKYVEVIRS